VIDGSNLNISQKAKLKHSKSFTGPQDPSSSSVGGLFIPDSFQPPPSQSRSATETGKGEEELGNSILRFVIELTELITAK